MQRILRIASLMLLASVVAGGAALADSDVHVFLGQKQISDNLVEDIGVDKLTEFGVGVNLDFDWPVMLTVDALVGSDDHSYTYSYAGRGGSYTYKYDLDTTELHVGARYGFLKDGKVKPYVGAGLAWVQADLKVVGSFTTRGGSSTLFDEDDSDVSYFLNGGVLFALGEKFDIGVDLRFSDAEADFGSSGGRGTSSPKIDIGGFHYGVTLGYRW